MGKVLYTFEKTVKSKIILSIILGTLFILTPIVLSFLHFFTNGLDNSWVYGLYLLLIIVGFFIIKLTGRSKIEMYKDYMIISGLFKNEKVYYKDIMHINCSYFLTNVNNTHKDFLPFNFVLVYNNDILRQMIDDGHMTLKGIETEFKVGGQKLSKLIPIKRLETTLNKSNFLNTIKEGNQHLTLDETTEMFRKGYNLTNKEIKETIDYHREIK